VERHDRRVATGEADGKLDPEDCGAVEDVLDEFVAA
jgi:hypothetical protein